VEYLQRYPVDVGQEYMPSYMQTLNAGSLYDKLTSTQAPVPCQPALLEAQVCEPVGAFADGTKGRRGHSDSVTRIAIPHQMTFGALGHQTFLSVLTCTGSDATVTW
jgi:hypothetical protein